MRRVHYKRRPTATTLVATGGVGTGAPARGRPPAAECPPPSRLVRRGRGSWRARGPVGYELSVGYRLVMFDFDGTLADSWPWLQTVIGELADRYGFRRPDDGDLQKLRRTSPRETMALL